MKYSGAKMDGESLGTTMKYRKEVYQRVNRFPELYKRQAFAMLDYATADAINTTADSFIMASLLVLIEEFGFGTTENSTRINKFIDALQTVIDTNADQYEESVAEGLKHKLHNYGVEYMMRADKRRGEK